MNKVIDIKATARDGSKVRCGDCVHFKDTPNPAVAEVPCSQNGVLATKIAPPCYTADVAALRSLGCDNLKALHSLLTSATPRQLRILMGLMGNAVSLERRGLQFMEEVYFSTDGDPKSLQNLYVGYALSAMPENKVAIVGGSFLRGTNNACHAVLYKSSLLKKADYRKCVKNLTQEGKVFEHRKPTRNLSLSEEDIPTIEMSIEDMEKRARGKGKKRAAPEKEAEVTPIVKRGRGRPSSKPKEDEKPRPKGVIFSIGG